MTKFLCYKKIFKPSLKIWLISLKIMINKYNNQKNLGGSFQAMAQWRFRPGCPDIIQRIKWTHKIGNIGGQTPLTNSMLRVRHSEIPKPNTGRQLKKQLT